MISPQIIRISKCNSLSKSRRRKRMREIRIPRRKIIVTRVMKRKLPRSMIILSRREVRRGEVNLPRGEVNFPRR